MAKILTYEELIELAKKHYNEGGDGVYECWDKMVFDSYVKLFGPLTEKKALAMFGLDKEIEEEEEAARRYYSGEDYREDTVESDEYQEEDEYQEDHYTPSATAGDYSPSNPWDAPGMSIRDFI